MKKITVNSVRLPAIPGNLKLVPNWNSFGPFTDRTYTEGSVKSAKGKTLGYYSRCHYNNGKVEIKISLY